MDQAFSASAKELAFIHGELDRAFADVLALLDEGADDAKIAPALDGALRFLQGHHGLEDELVFPSLRRRAEGALSDAFLRLEAQHDALHGECEALLRLGITAPDLRSRLTVLRGRLAEHCRDEELLLSPENLAILVSVDELRELAQRIEARFAASAPWRH